MTERTTIYTGTNLTFRIFGGSWRVALTGSGIHASAVTRGLLTLRGESGTFSLDGGPFRRWPSEFRSFRLGD